MFESLERLVWLGEVAAIRRLLRTIEPPHAELAEFAAAQRQEVEEIAKASVAGAEAWAQEAELWRWIEAVAKGEVPACGECTAASGKDVTLYWVEGDPAERWLEWAQVKPRMVELGLNAASVRRDDGSYTLVGPSPGRTPEEVATWPGLEAWRYEQADRSQRLFA